MSQHRIQPWPGVTYKRTEGASQKGLEKVWNISLESLSLNLISHRTLIVTGSTNNLVVGDRRFFRDGSRESVSVATELLQHPRTLVNQPRAKGDELT